MTPKTIAVAQSKFVDAAGVRTHYYESGTGEALLLLHGGGAGADAYGNWRMCLDTFASEFNVFAIDMLGFGYTDKPDPSAYTYSQSGRNEHIIAVIEALGLESVNLVGNSMGGGTSMGVAIERPDLVSRLVLMGSAGVRHPINEEILSILNYDYTQDGMRRIVKGLTNPNFEVDEEMISYRHALSIRDDTRIAYDAIMGWIRDNGGLWYEDDYMHRVSQRTLVVNGKLDRVAPVTCAYRLLELIADSWGYIIPDCGHWAMIERPREFTSAVMHFLKENQYPRS